MHTLVAKCISFEGKSDFLNLGEYRVRFNGESQILGGQDFTR